MQRNAWAAERRTARTVGDFIVLTPCAFQCDEGPGHGCVDPTERRRNRFAKHGPAGRLCCVGAYGLSVSLVDALPRLLGILRRLLGRTGLLCLLSLVSGQLVLHGLQLPLHLIDLSLQVALIGEGGSGQKKTRPDPRVL